MELKTGTVMLLILTGLLLVASGEALSQEMGRKTPVTRTALLESGIPPVPYVNPGTLGTPRRRRRRMSCEALSFPLPFGHMNHAACASFCFVNGKNFRGHCEFGWCKCK